MKKSLFLFSTLPALATITGTLALAGLSSAALGQTMEAKEAGEVRFLATARPGGVRIAGKAAAPTGKLAVKPAGGAGGEVALTGELKLPLKAFETGISLRDRHMKEKYLEVEKFPEATLVVSDLKLKANAPTPFSGELTLHGVKRKVDGTAEWSQAGSGAQVKAKFDLKLTDFGIEQPSFAGITVSEQVSVDTDFHLVTVN